MRVFARGIDDARNVAIERSEGRDPRELDRLPFSAALVISSAAVRTAGMLRSDAGTVLTRCTIASRRDASVTPPGISIGSAKRLSQDTTQLRNRTGIQAEGQRLVPAQKSPGRCRGFER